jgi:Putative DNA-binding domain
MGTSMKDRWTEQEVANLPAGEHDYFERKSGKLLGDSDWPRQLGKALSALANSGGGHVFIGVENDGRLEGVDPIHRGKAATREWLEQVCPGLVDYPLENFRVHEVEPSTPSSIPMGKVVIVIDVLDSERAPHQSQHDKKYYVRIGGRSEPASHRLIEDIRNRTKHPSLNVEKMEILEFSWGAREEIGDVQLRIKVTLSNCSKIKAQNVCLVATTDYGAFIAVQGYTTDGARARFNTAQEAFWELLHPVYPSMRTAFQFLLSARARKWTHGGSIYYVIPDRNPAPSLHPPPDKSLIDSVNVGWKLFADSAPPKEGSCTLAEMGFREKSLAAGR